MLTTMECQKCLLGGIFMRQPSGKAAGNQHSSELVWLMHTDGECKAPEVTEAGPEAETLFMK